MRKVKFFYRMALQFSQPVWQHSFSLRAFPLPLPEQQIYGLSWSLEPDVPLTFQRDCFGNVVGSGRFEDQHNHFQYEMSGVAWLEPARKKREICPALYRYPSAACQMTEPLQHFLQQCPLSEDAAEFARAVQLMNCLHQQFQYEAGVTSAFTTAGDAFAQGRGVCQDYAQILLTLCRASGIAARYVAGMIFGEGATHAWVEVYDTARQVWLGLDPTQNKLTDDGYLKLAQGRDYLDCRLNRGIFSGLAAQKQDVYVNLEEVV